MLKGWRLRVSKMICIPQRYILGIMGSLCVLNALTMRVALSVAITEMVISTKKDTSQNTCPENVKSYKASVKNKNAQYKWDEDAQGWILGAFYIGYLATHIPGGLLAERFGGKHVLGFGILFPAVLTLVTPVIIIYTKGDWRIVVVLRVFIGLAQGPIFPALSLLIAKWVPVSERGTIGSICFAGAQMGTVLSNAVSGALIRATGHWASVFYLFGGMGLLWYIFWIILCFSEPSTHPYISDKEREFLEKELVSAHGKRMKTPWKKILTSLPVWAMTSAQVGHDWGLYTMVSDLPKYFRAVLHFDVQSNGFMASLPYLVMWIFSIISGYVCDLVVKKKCLTLTWARKTFTSISHFGPATFLILAVYMGCHQILSVTMFTIGMGFMGSYICGFKVNAADLAPNFAGTIMAVANGIGSITGILTPYVVAVIAKDQTVAEWKTVFWISFGVLVGTNIIYMVFASAEVQKWNEGDSKEEIT